MARVLLGAGADASLANRMRWTPAMEAALYGHAEVLEALFAPTTGISVVATNVDLLGPCDWTALHFAATRGRAAAIRVLLDHGADVNARTNLDCTPLFLVCRRGHAGLMQTLLDAGADFASIDRDGRSPLGVAAERGHDAVVRALLNFATDEDRAAARKLVLGDNQSLIVELLKPSSTNEAASAAVDGKSSACGDEQETDYSADTPSDKARPDSVIEQGWVDVTAMLDDVGRLEVREANQVDGSHC